MCKKGMPEATATRPDVLLKRLCPVRQTRGKQFRINGKGSIYYQGGWRKISAVIRRREQQRLRENERYRDPAFAKRKCKQRRDNYDKHIERERDRQRRKYWTVSDAKRREWSARRAVNAAADIARKEKQWEWHSRRNPSYGLHRAISNFRRGKIGILELDRLIARSLARLNEGRGQGEPEASDKPGKRKRSVQHRKEHA